MEEITNVVMSDKQRLHLQNMIKANNVEDQTELIRQLKHSEMFKVEIRKMLDIKETHKNELDAELTIYTECMSEAKFMFTYYTDLFNKIRKDEINIDLLYKFVDILKQIEEGKEDQHTASFLVGTILKQIYVDSALKKADKLNENESLKTNTYQNNVEKKITWNEFKKTHNIIQ
jgi:hypothetical protein